MYKAELDRVLSTYVKDQGLKDISACLRKYIRVFILDAETMKEKCESCKLAKGSQKVVELMRLGSYLALSVDKTEPTAVMDIPLKLSLDRYMSRSVGSCLNGNDFEIVGCIG